MNVAIIGGGLAGLSCAHELERYGIQPTIFEVNSFIGEQYPHVGAALEIATRSIGDPIKYFKSQLNLNLKPINTVNSIIHHSPTKTTVIKGKLGYFFNRSKECDDLKVQIHSMLKKPNILFNTYGDYEPLSQKFDYVIIANGQSNFSKELGCWTEWVNTFVRGAVVLGDFDPNAIIIWLNKEYCKNGYAYLTPFDKKRASLILVVTDVSKSEVDHYWELFLYSENIKCPLVEEFKLNHQSGRVYPHKVDNILLTGNAGGVIDPFLGFGVLGSVVTGVMAARSIILNKPYDKLIEGILKTNLQLYEFRKALNSVNNDAYDKIVSSIGLPGVRQLIYKSPINIIKYGSYVLKAMPKKEKR